MKGWKRRVEMLKDKTPWNELDWSRIRSIHILRKFLRESYRSQEALKGILSRVNADEEMVAVTPESPPPHPPVKQVIQHEPAVLEQLISDVTGPNTSFQQQRVNSR
jgi:hypothetical protein